MRPGLPVGGGSGPGILAVTPGHVLDAQSAKT